MDDERTIDEWLDLWRRWQIFCENGNKRSANIVFKNFLEKFHKGNKYKAALDVRNTVVNTGIFKEGFESHSFEEISIYLALHGF